MITKQEAAEHLVKLGYDAKSKDGSVLVTVEKPMTKRDMKKMERHLQEIGYNSSYGWMVKQNAK